MWAVLAVTKKRISTKETIKKFLGRFMSARYAIIAAAVILFAGALLYAADWSSVSTRPQPSTVFQVR